MRRSIVACLVEMRDGWYYQEPHADVRLIVPRSAQASEIAEAVRSLQAGRKPRQIALLLDARSLLFSSFGLDDVAGSRSRASLLFRLEADLPISAEEMLADFQISDTGRVAAVATEKERVLPLVVELARQGVGIRCILPASLVTAQALIENRLISPTCLLTLLNQQSTETLLLEESAVRSWRLVPQGKGFSREFPLLAAMLDAPPAEIVVGDKTQLDVWRNRSEARLIEADLDQLRLAMAIKISARDRAWFDLSNDPAVDDALSGPGNNRLLRIVATWAVCLLVITAACMWRATRIRSSANAIREQTREVFRATFPETSIPSAVVARLKSEHTKVVASRTTGGQSVSLANSALPILERLLLGLPQQLSFSVHEIRIEDGDIYVELDLDEHDHAGAVAEALQQQGLILSPPNTQNQDGRIRAVIRGRIAEGAGT